RARRPGALRRRARRRRRNRATRARLILQLGLELVPDAVACLDERVLGGTAVDLVPQAPHEDVDVAVAAELAPAPGPLPQLVAGHDAPAVERELVQQPELRRCQLHALAVDVRL